MDVRAAATADDVLRVQKYPNRRLYDRTNSRHLTQEQLFDLIAAGRRVEVSDSRSGEDITNLVLAQVLLERDPLKLAAMPSELFHLLIRANHRLLPSLQRAMVEATAALLQGWSGWRAMGEQMSAFMRPPAAAFSPFAPLTPLAPWLAPPTQPQPQPQPQPRPQTAPGDAADGAAEELAELRREVAALRAQGRGGPDRSENRAAKRTSPGTANRPAGRRKG